MEKIKSLNSIHPSDCKFSDTFIYHNTDLVNKTQEYDAQLKTLLIIIQFIETNKIELKLVVKHIYCHRAVDSFLLGFVYFI